MAAAIEQENEVLEVRGQIVWDTVLLGPDDEEPDMERLRCDLVELWKRADSRHKRIRIVAIEF